MRSTAVLFALVALACNETPTPSREAGASPKPNPAAAPEVAEQRVPQHRGEGSGDGACQLVREGYGPKGTVPLQVEVVVAGLEVPWGLAFLPDGGMLVTERAGRIRLVRGGELVAKPVAEVEAVARAEGGLLGLTLAPDFAASRRFFVYYSAQGEQGVRNRIERWTLSADGTSAAPAKVVLDGIPAARYHDGGRIAFGPDGMLYAGTGDATQPALAQKRDSLAGKILRITPDGAPAEGNPLPGNPAWIIGVRNVQGFDWRDDGSLIVADHGPSGELGRKGHDELSIARRGDDLGWPQIYGCRQRDGMQRPVLVWRQAAPPGGAIVYRGDAIPQWRGDVLIATLGSRHLHRVHFAPDAPDRVASHEVYLEGDPPSGHGRLRTIVTGPDGAVYVTTSNCDGRGTCPADKDRILRIRSGGG